MKSLIIHLGPPKCGSTTIQRFFGSFKNPCVEKIRYFVPTPIILEQLSKESEIPSTDFTNILDNNLSQCDCLIVSHESLYLNRIALRNICSLASPMVTRIIIIGYSRRASDFIESAYNQWGFRNPISINRDNGLLLNNRIEPLHFLGVEKKLISSIVDDFSFRTPPLMNWHDSYGLIENIVSPLKVEIKPGVLPSIKSSETLIQDFCKMTGLTLRDEHKEVDLKFNLQFNTILTESINDGVEIGLDLPGPHSENNFLQEISKFIRSDLYSDNRFLVILKEYVDSYFYKSNIDFCRKYGLDENYFSISREWSKEEILDVIKSEQLKRIADNSMLKKYKELTGVMAEACFHYYKIQKHEPLKPRSILNRLYRKIKRLK